MSTDVRAVVLTSLQVDRRANYHAQHVRELAWREEQQQLHNARECDLEVSKLYGSDV